MRIYDNLPTEGVRKGTGNGERGTRPSKVLPDYETLDIATGCFDLRGWAVLDDEIRRRREQGADGPIVRLLVGMVTASQHDQRLRDLDMEGAGVQRKRADRLMAQERKAGVVRALGEQPSRRQSFWPLTALWIKWSIALSALPGNLTAMRNA
ncbi:hypothetical protein I6B53_08535 [Schaalia sp. 19OD2882]|nr:hypothetical protein [Schaalia sp. 19OD2882]QWW19147.1 hypothetical protein I6B53_08535 [Schaalia sp. 19OD2882]